MIQIIKLQSEDATLFQDLLQVFAQVFERADFVQPSHAYLQSLLAKDSLVVYVALQEAEVLGGLTAYELPMYYAPGSEMFLYDIGIRPDCQRRGLGKALLQTLQKHCCHRGITSLFVAADEEDQHALDFYQSTGGKAAMVRHYSYTLSPEPNTD